MSKLTDLVVHGKTTDDESAAAQLRRDFDRYAFALELAQDLGHKLQLELNPPLVAKRHEMADGLDRSLLWLAKVLNWSWEAQKRIGGAP